MQGEKGEKGDTGEQGPIGNTIWNNDDTNPDIYYNQGNVSIGKKTSHAKLDVNGSIKVGEDDSECNENKAGVIRYRDSKIQYCNEKKWLTLSFEKNVVKDIDGNEYDIVNIGSQVWMAQNLRSREVRMVKLFLVNAIQTQMEVIIVIQLEVYINGLLQ